MTFFDGWSTYLHDLLYGLWMSLRLTAAVLLIGLPGGLALALGASSPRRVVRAVAVVLTEIGRGTPALVVLQLFYFGLPSAGLTLAAFTAASLALAVTTAAYTSEIMRGGLQAVPQGEVEAAFALGMARRDAWRFVVIPQGLRIAIPPLMSFAIMIFQATSLAYTIAIPELMSQAYTIGSVTFRYLSVLTLAGLLYAAITIPASVLCARVEQRLARLR